jgi:SAM-dependent methyltransferase
VGFVFGYGSNPAARVYESVGPEFPLAPAPGWLNLGLWEGPGSEEEAPRAVRRLVERLAGVLPTGVTVVDVGNGLGAQDPVIAEVASPARLVAVNITEAQLRAGRERLAKARALPVVGDATRLPLAAASAGGLISVEAAFHFRSRRVFFDEAFRVLRPGGVLSISDVPTMRWPRTPGELVSGLGQLRLWGLRVAAAATPDQIASQVERAGFVDLQCELVGDRVIAPALRLLRDRMRRVGGELPGSQRLAGEVFRRQVELLWRRHVVDYLLLSARRP